MVDILTPKKRSEVMANIKSKNTHGEILVRKELHKMGFRYQLHRKGIPGKPDLAFPKFRAVIFINGCFWHAHDCHLFKWPSSRPEFWREKINSNKIRDEKNYINCTELGWRILIIWECALKGKTKRPLNEVVNTTKNWLLYDTQSAEIKGKDVTYSL